MISKSYTEQNGILLLAFIASATVIGVYIIWVLSLSLNIPYRDDFEDILVFVVGFHNSTEFSQALSFLLDQHADHLTLSSRLVYYVVYLVQGVVDFRTLAYISHLGLLALAWLFYLQLDIKIRYKPLLFICLCLLLFHPRAYGLVIWPMATFQIYFTYAYVLASLYFLNRTGHANLVLALAAGVLASFSMIIGQFVWFIGLIVFFQRRKDANFPLGKYLGLWLITAAAVLTAFHSIFESVFPASELLKYALRNPIVEIQAYVAMLGAAIGMGYMLVSQILGVLALVLSLLFLAQAFRRGFTPAHLFLLFILASIGVIVLGRVFSAEAFGFPLEKVVFKPRYSFSSLMLWTTLFVLSVNQIRNFDGRKAIGLLFTCLIFNSCIYFVFQPVLTAHQAFRMSYFNGQGVATMGDADTGPVLIKAAEAGIYLPPDSPYRINKRQEGKKLSDRHHLF